MSAAPPAHGHGDHDDHAFTGEPVQVLPADEPRTPAWLTLLGVALFTLLAVFILVTHGGSPTGAADHAAQPAAAPGGAAPGAEKVTPEQLEELQKRIREARAKGLLPDNRPGK